MVLFRNFPCNAVPRSLLGTFSTFNKATVISFGVYIDGSLKLSRQVSAVVKSGFCHLTVLAKVEPRLAANTFDHVINLFVTCRLDYCNAMYIGLE